MSIFNNDPIEGNEAAAQFQGMEQDPTPPSIPSSPAPSASQPEGTKSRTVILSKEREHEALPEGLTNIGNVSVEIPNAEAQAAGFHLPKVEAATLVAQFPQYKFFIDKGQATPTVRIGE